MSRLRFIEPQLASPVDQPPEGKHGFTESNTIALALYPNALYCDCGKCSALEDTMLEEFKGALALIVDKWNVSEQEGYTLVEYAGRGLGIPEDLTELPAVGSYVGNYRFKPDGSFTASGTGTETFKDEGTTNYTWKESSDPREENTYEYTGGTGIYEGVSGGGTYTSYTYTYDIGPGTLQTCRYKGKIVFP